MRSRFSIMLIVLLTVLISSAAHAQDEDSAQYQKYEPKHTVETMFRVTFTKEEVRISIATETGEVSVSQDRDKIAIGPRRVTLDSAVYFDADGLHFDDSLFSYDMITETRVTDRDDVVTIAFQTVRGDTNRLARLRRGSRLSFDRNMIVAQDEFVRGMLFTVTGDLESYGEVNRDIVSLFGNIYLGPGAVARGDLAAITGEIDIASDASVYGELYSGTEYFTKRQPRFYRHAKNANLYNVFAYNRVDGLTLGAGVEFEDLDSLLPNVWAEAGYTYSSERWRARIGLEQPLWRVRPLAIGGEYYRRIASEDDWLLTDHENHAFAFLASEDYKGFWEAEGATGWVTFKPLENITFEGRYRYEETNWLRAYRNLWSLWRTFDSDARFPENYRRVPTAVRMQGMAEIDTTANGALSARLEWDTHNTGDPFSTSRWHITGDIEWSDPGLNSDFDYRRYNLTVRRYQRVHDRAMVLLRGVFANSDGYLPMHKRYYIGGLGTLRGYKHKELAGSRFWMTNAEYRFVFPETDLAASLFWDAAQIAYDTEIDGDIDIKQSLGVGLALGDNLRVNLAKRLDRSYDDDIQVYVRFDHMF